jgi:ketosteroid isomerase-like protein
MSREKVELVREMYEAYLAGDVERALARVHPEVKVDFSDRPDAGVRHGPQALAELSSSWQASFEQYTEELDEVREIGDFVCLVTTQRGKTKGSDFEITDQVAFLVEVNDGQITGLTGYTNPKEAVVAAEASERN